MSIRRLEIPVDCEGHEVASISRHEDGECILTVELGDSNPDTWGIMLSDLLRQVAISFERTNLKLNGKVLGRAEIESEIKNMFDLELAKPSDSVDQVRQDVRLRLVDAERTD